MRGVITNDDRYAVKESHADFERQVRALERECIRRLTHSLDQDQYIVEGLWRVAKNGD